MRIYEFTTSFFVQVLLLVISALVATKSFKLVTYCEATLGLQAKSEKRFLLNEIGNAINAIGSVFGGGVKGLAGVAVAGASAGAAIGFLGGLSKNTSLTSNSSY